jgi:hypothetical protein
MRKFLSLFFLCSSIFAADTAKDIIVSQQNDSGTGKVQRNITGTANRLVGTDASGHPVIVSVTGTTPVTATMAASAVTIGISTASTSTNGALTSTDWNTFNNKVSSGAAPWVPTSANTDSYTTSSHAGTITVTKGTGIITGASDATTEVLTMSSDTSTLNTIISRKLVNPYTTLKVFTINSAAAAGIDSVTVPAASFVWRSWQSSGTAWTATSGASIINDLIGGSAGDAIVYEGSSSITAVSKKYTDNGIVTSLAANAVSKGLVANSTTSGAASATILTAVQSIPYTTPASVNLGNCTGTISIDWSLGNVFYGVLTGSTTFTFTGAVDGQTIVVQVAQTGTNSYTVAWPAAKWHSATAPTMTAGSATSDVTTFVNYGGTYYGNSVQDLH